MIDKLKYATISDIYVKKLEFYTPENIESSIKFCQDRGITYLPDRKRQKCYELVGEKFAERNLNSIEQCNPYDPIFSLDTLEKFNKRNTDNVIFVTENELIKGVVHIVDYNQDFIFFELYKLLFTYEKMLREFLIQNKEDNESFLEFIQKQADTEQANENEKNNYWTRRLTEYKGDTESKIRIRKKERSALGQFQSFYFSDLIEFWKSKPFFELKNEYSLKNLRNRIAHSRDIIRQDREENANHLYNFKGLTIFIKDALRFFEDFEVLQENLIDKK